MIHRVLIMVTLVNENLACSMQCLTKTRNKLKHFPRHGSYDIIEFCIFCFLPDVISDLVGSCSSFLGE